MFFIDCWIAKIAKKSLPCKFPRWTLPPRFYILYSWHCHFPAYV